MRRSCLVMLVLVAAVLLVVSVSLRRCFLADSRVPVATAQAKPVVEATQTEVVARATLTAALLSIESTSGEGVQGLALEALRPLSTEQMTVSGLAVSEDRVYATGCDASGLCGQIIVTDAGTLTTQSRMTITYEGYSQAGGLLVAGDALWVWLLADGAEDATLVVSLDRATLSERSRIKLQGTARALAVDSDGTIIGASANGRFLYRWAAEGGLLARHVSATGARYTDCEVISNSLVCAGVREDGLGVLDVLDAEQFSLLARHLSSAVTESGDGVVGGAWAYSQDRFYFVPVGGELPILWTFRLQGGTLDQYIPSVPR